MDLEDIPKERLHDSGTACTFGGILLALITTVVGATVLGAGYGAIMAISGKIYFNIGLAFTIPFWVNTPAGMGALFGHIQNPKWQTRIRLLGFLICCYTICVGWLGAVLDGPGLVFNPIELAGHLADSSLYGLWVVNWELEPDAKSLSFWFLTLRFGELLWITHASLMSGGGPLPYPYCQNCKCFMWDNAEIRLKYDPPSHEEARLLSKAMVNEQYGSLLMLHEPVDSPKDKGLEINVFRCEKCKAQHTLDANWYPSKLDPERSEGEQLFESAAGIELAKGLIIPDEIFEHFSQMTAQLENEESVEVKKAA